MDQLECIVSKCKNVIGVRMPCNNLNVRNFWASRLNLSDILTARDVMVCFYHYNLANLYQEGPVSTEENFEASQICIPTNYDLNNVCRTCGTRQTFKWTVHDKLETIPIKTMLVECFEPTQMNFERGPQHICNYCIDSLKSAYKFKKQTLVLNSIINERCPLISPEVVKEVDVNDIVTSRGVRIRLNNLKTELQRRLDQLKPRQYPDLLLMQEIEPVIFDKLHPNPKRRKLDRNSETLVSEVALRRHEQLTEAMVPPSKKMLTLSGTLDRIIYDNTRKTNEQLVIGPNGIQLAQVSKRVMDPKLKASIQSKQITKLFEVPKPTASALNQVTKLVPVAKPPATALNQVTKLVPGASTTTLSQMLTVPKSAASTINQISKLVGTSKTTSNSSPVNKLILNDISQINSDSVKLLLSQQKSPLELIVLSNKAGSKITSINLDSTKKFDNSNKSTYSSKKSSIQQNANPCYIKSGYFGNTYLEMNNYVYNFGIVKNNEKYLSCVKSECSAALKQLSTDGESYELEILCEHNHRGLTEGDKKREICIDSLRRKSNNKGFNIRSLYEKVCKMDEGLSFLLPMKEICDEICFYKSMPTTVKTFKELYDKIETKEFEQIHFTDSEIQFYKERFTANDGSYAIVFASSAIKNDYVLTSNTMYVDASFHIKSVLKFNFQLVTILVAVRDTYLPVLYVLINKKSQELFKKVFHYFRDFIAPKFKPKLIITSFEASLNYALRHTYKDASIGGSLFYYIQDIYKKVCKLNLNSEIEEDSDAKNTFYKLLMLPLLPVNTIVDAFKNIEQQAKESESQEKILPILEHIENQWLTKVTPQIFCVHNVEERINENVVPCFMKLRELISALKRRYSTIRSDQQIVHIIRKLIDLEDFLKKGYTPNLNVLNKGEEKTFSTPQLKAFKCVLTVWKNIEVHPEIDLNHFYSVVVNFLKNMENQLWLWGLYRCTSDDMDDVLISASSFITENEHSYANNSQIDSSTQQNFSADNKIDVEEGYLVETQDEIFTDNVQHTEEL